MTTNTVAATAWRGTSANAAVVETPGCSACVAPTRLSGAAKLTKRTTIATIVKRLTASAGQRWAMTANTNPPMHVFTTVKTATAAGERGLNSGSMPRPVRRAVARTTFARAEITAATRVARPIRRRDGLAVVGPRRPLVGARCSGVAGRCAAVLIDRLTRSAFSAVVVRRLKASRPSRLSPGQQGRDVPKRRREEDRRRFGGMTVGARRRAAPPWSGYSVGQRRRSRRNDLAR